MVHSTLGILAFWLGITNLIGLVLFVLSCRCVLGKWLKLRQSKKFMHFYRYHCYYLWFFVISVLFHSIFALIAYGYPL